MNDRSIVTTDDSVADALWRANDALAAQITALEARELSHADVTALREMLEQDRRTRWLWSTARTWALWVTAVVVGITVGFDALRTVVKRLIA